MGCSRAGTVPGDVTKSPTTCSGDVRPPRRQSGGGHQAELVICDQPIERHILAQFDDESIIVYQAYNHAIGRYVVEHGRFGGEFSFARMSWVKPNFLWIMYRSGWGTKENQEVTLALRLRREFFDSLLAEAVPSTWDRDLFATSEEWSRAVGRSSVRLQWDPDHHPSGAKLDRRAIQLGLRGAVLEAFGMTELLEVIDLSEFVAEQQSVLTSRATSALLTPRERVYVPADPTIAVRLRLSPQDANKPRA
jgi:hypothetical protein